MDVDISAGSQWWWKLPASLAMIGALAALFGWIGIGLRNCAYPKQNPCVESAEIIDIHAASRACPPGGRMWTVALSSERVELHCSCEAAIDAGTRP